jgi:hypothetical protein
MSGCFGLKIINLVRRVSPHQLVEHAWNMDNNFEFDRAKPNGRERLWNARKCHEAMEIYLCVQNFVIVPSMDLDPVWFSTLS